MIKRKRKEAKFMDEQCITLEEITSFYKQYGITATKAEECQAVPSAYDDIPLQYSNSTSQNSETNN